MSLLGGGNIDGKIHRKAGIQFSLKCRALPIKGKDSNGNDIRCHTGECEVTDTVNTKLEGSFKYVFHTVGPDCRKEPNMDKNATKLKKCYESILQKVLDFDVKSIALCCISTGVYEYPKEPAANIAFETVTSWLEKNHHSVEMITFCTYEKEDSEIYNHLLNRYLISHQVIGDDKKIDQVTPSNEIEIAEPMNSTQCTDTNTVHDEVSTTREDNAGTKNDIVDDIIEHTSNSVVTINDSVDGSFLTEQVPVTLRNSGENICFLNSVVQVLYSLLPFRAHIFNTSLNNNVVTTIRQLFREIEICPQYAIPTYEYAASLNIPNYNHYRREQIDVREVVQYLAENCFEQRIVINQILVFLK